MGELAVALAGCGRLAERGYLPALRAVRGARLVAVADPVLERRQRIAALAAGRGPVVVAFPNVAALLEDTAVDAIILATPAAAHVTDAGLAAAAGVATLVEKPPAGDEVSAAQLTALRPAPWVAFNRRFEPGNTAMRASVPSGVPVDLQLELRYRRRSWSAHTVADEALLDLGPHLVDLARWLTGSDVTAVVDAELRHERARFELELTSGRARIRCATAQPHRERIEIRDDDGRRLAHRHRGGPLAGVLARLPGRSAEPHPLMASLVGQLEAFVGAVRGEPSPTLGTAADGHAVMAVLGAVRTCAERGGPVPVTLPRVSPSARTPTDLPSPPPTPE